VIGSLSFILCEQIKACRETLFNWSKFLFGGENQQIQSRMLTLETLSKANNKGQNSRLISSYRAEVNELLLRKELH
jgi:hypothetical protein